ncbi:MAG: helix-turn-helix transcriptional regulator [bacterium]|nr:helix-turn-helix transcriptional regulator [bacterium]
MAACRNKLWKLLIDREMTKTQLCQAAKGKYKCCCKNGRDEDVGVDVLNRICEALDCSFEDIMGLISFENQKGDVAPFLDTAEFHLFDGRRTVL